MKKARIRASIQFEMEVVENNKRLICGDLEVMRTIEITADELDNFRGDLSELLQIRLEALITKKTFRGPALEFASVWRQSQ